ncbi:MAG TPA: hypothetical protein VKV74_03645 [Bryobacteraceae bacterium]|nr:hypothetical protein [Bryobacteraceae bacterium]
MGYYNFDNKMDYDTVGVSPDIVTYYNGINVQGSTNAQNRVPCTMTAPQTMYIYAFTGSQAYTLNSLTISIQQGWFGMAKISGNEPQPPWRQYACGGGACNPL